MRRAAVLAALAAILVASSATQAAAHAGPRNTQPAAGATLGDTPTHVQLTFSEQPEPSLSDIRVVDSRGAVYQVGSAERVAGDPLALKVRVKPLERGVYIVNWRVVSATDGHTTQGAYAFGVRADPSVAVGAAATNPPPSTLELSARWLLTAGLVVLLGAAAAAIAGFGGSRDLALAAAGWVAAAAGVALLAIAQSRNSGAPVATLLGTTLGRALMWRSLAIFVAGGALVLARERAGMHRRAIGVAALATLAAMAVHAAAGHAAAGRSWRMAVSVAGQWTHFAAAGVWIGGLAALLLAVRGSSSPAKAAAVRRFARVAAGCLVVVAGTGVLRAAGEMSTFGDFISTSYGRAVLAKVGLTALIAACGAINRWRGVPAALYSLVVLRRAGAAELAVASTVLAAAALLGVLPPPAAGLVAAREIVASGVDFGTSVRLQLTTGSDQPGPNRFIVRAKDFDSGRLLRASRISLRFTPLDDPGVASTSLALRARDDGSYAASGANIAFDGRWRVTGLIERETQSVEVPLDILVPTGRQFVSIERTPGAHPAYTVEVRGAGHVRISPERERPGAAVVRITCYDVLFNLRPIDDLVVTTSSADGTTRQQAVRRIDGSRFLADVDLRPGANTIAVVARGSDGTRMRAVTELVIGS